MKAAEFKTAVQGRRRGPLEEVTLDARGSVDGIPSTAPRAPSLPPAPPISAVQHTQTHHTVYMTKLMEQQVQMLEALTRSARPDHRPPPPPATNQATTIMYCALGGFAMCLTSVVATVWLAASVVRTFQGM